MTGKKVNHDIKTLQQIASESNSEAVKKSLEELKNLQRALAQDGLSAAERRRIQSRIASISAALVRELGGDGIDYRVKALKLRLQNGVKNKNITNKEKTEIEKLLADFETQYAAMKADGLTEEETQTLNTMLNHISDTIKLRNNNQENLQKQIEKRRASLNKLREEGSIGPNQLKNFLSRLRATEKKLKQYRSQSEDKKLTREQRLEIITEINSLGAEAQQKKGENIKKKNDKKKKNKK